MKSHSRSLALVVAAFAVSACGSSLPTAAPTYKPLAVFDLTPPSVLLVPGDQFKLTAAVPDSLRGTQSTLRWSSDALGVATVSSGGVVHAVGRGLAKITFGNATAAAYAYVNVIIPDPQ